MRSLIIPSLDKKKIKTTAFLNLLVTVVVVATLTILETACRLDLRLLVSQYFSGHVCLHA